CASALMTTLSLICIVRPILLAPSLTCAVRALSSLGSRLRPDLTGRQRPTSSGSRLSRQGERTGERIRHRGDSGVRAGAALFGARLGHAVPIVGDRRVAMGNRTAVLVDSDEDDPVDAEDGLAR